MRALSTSPSISPKSVALVAIASPPPYRRPQPAQRREREADAHLAPADTNQDMARLIAPEELHEVLRHEHRLLRPIGERLAPGTQPSEIPKVGAEQIGGSVARELQHPRRFRVSGPTAQTLPRRGV